MLCFLHRSVNHFALQVPISPATAASLIEVVLEPEFTTRSHKLQSILEHDPLFSWSITCLAAQQQTTLLTAQQAATWLAHNSLSKLAAIGHEITVESPQRFQKPWAAQSAVEFARQLANHMSANTLVSADEAYWTGLLYQAHLWIKETGHEQIHEFECAFLNQILEIAPTLQGLEPKPPKEANALYAEAIRQISSQQAALYQTTEIDAFNPSGESHRFDNETSGSFDYLPELIQKLLRLEQLETSFEQAKLAALKEFAYGAGHEINNPLANISARAQTLLKETANPEHQRRLASIHTQAMRAYEMIADLMHFAKPPALVYEKTDIQLLVQEIISHNQRQLLGLREIGFEFSASTDNENFEIDCDRAQLQVAIQALISNALDALGPSGTISIKLRRTELHTSNDGTSQIPTKTSHLEASFLETACVSGLEISVRDTGTGIASEIVPHLFEPFFSGREAGRGLGFGLSKCWGIVTSHQGSITVDSRLGVGSCITMLLPTRPIETSESLKCD